MNSYLKYLQNHLKQSLSESNKSCYVLGVSGGIDSIVSLYLLINTIPTNQIKPYFIDINSKYDKQYLKEIIDVCNKHNIDLKIIDLSNEFSLIANKFDLKEINNINNLKPKLRSMYLYSQAFELNGLVLNTTNLTEFVLGYFTKFGDSNGDVYLLNGLLKTQVYQLAKLLSVPEVFIKRIPTADLNHTTDIDELGYEYIDLDKFVLNYLNQDYNLIPVKILNRIKNNEHKVNIFKTTLLRQYKK